MLPCLMYKIAWSLNDNMERLAFSCIWIMNMGGTVEKEDKANRE